MKSMIKLMRYNNFKKDPLSKCDCSPPYSGENAISARNDLNPKSGTYPFGALGHRSHGGTVGVQRFKKGGIFEKPKRNHNHLGTLSLP